jgi:hypothetical protein
MWKKERERERERERAKPRNLLYHNKKKTPREYNCQLFHLHK